MDEIAKIRERENKKFFEDLNKGDYPDEWGIDIDNFDKEAEIAKYEGLHMSAREGIAIRLFIHPKKKGNFIIPDSVHEDQQFSSCVGLVVKVSKNAYRGERYTKPWTKIGDWVVFPRHSGDKIGYKGLPTFLVWEDGIWTPVDDPRTISRI